MKNVIVYGPDTPDQSGDLLASHGVNLTDAEVELRLATCEAYLRDGSQWDEDLDLDMGMWTCRITGGPDSVDNIRHALRSGVGRIGRKGAQA